MQPAKYTASDTRLIDLGTKVIYKYPTPTKDFDVGRMVVDGRHPAKPGSFIIEEACSFVMYVMHGRGTVYAGDQIFKVGPEDVVFVPKQHKFAVEGQFEYITFDAPAFYPEQTKEV